MSVKNKVLVLDEKICYFAKESYSCEYEAIPYYYDTSIPYFTVIDLNKNGLELDDSYAAIIRGYFDEKSYKLKSWIGEKEGIVVVNKNEIRSLYDIMDNAEKNYFSYTHPSDLFKAFDYNKDKIVDNEDPGFKYLYIWQDANQDMICQADEVKSFAEVGINSIELARQTSCSNDNQECSNNNYIGRDKLVCNGDSGNFDLFSVSLLQYMN